MIVTTTNVVDGYRVVEYFPPIVVNVVMGTGLFFDWIADFSDVLGGKSEVYQQYHSDMFSEATRELEAKASQAGANCVLGVSYDMDEISGRGKQMFMLHAYGTPVLIKTDQQIVDEAASEERSRADLKRLDQERQERFAGVDSIAGLLDDAQIGFAAREMRRLYGKSAAASFLRAKAAELGVGDIDLREEDLPDTF
jgi:uncharacterized protein YbjQ (UPF0145 family)